MTWLSENRWLIGVACTCLILAAGVFRLSISRKPPARSPRTPVQDRARKGDF